jgi:sulfite reductase (NADPH) flavoprotein alpha-component
MSKLQGSQSGNAESLAKKLVKEAKSQGYETTSAPLEKVSLAALAQEKCALIITSTWGEGDPPDNAVSFWEELQAQTDTSLTNLSFSVLALGDTNYEHFCGFGKKVDSRLEELGAKRIFERIDCNVDFVEGASRWQKGVFEAVSKINGAGEAQPLNGSSAVSANGSAKPVTEKKKLGIRAKIRFWPDCLLIASLPERVRKKILAITRFASRVRPYV